MATAPPTTVITSFDLLPGREPVWESAYREILRREREKSGSGLHWAHLLRDLNDNNHVVMLSEWDSPQAFDRFVRDAALIWERRGLEYSSKPAEVTFLQPIEPQD